MDNQAEFMVATCFIEMLDGLLFKFKRRESDKVKEITLEVKKKQKRTDYESIRVTLNELKSSFKSLVEFDTIRKIMTGSDEKTGEDDGGEDDGEKSEKIKCEPPALSEEAKRALFKFNEKWHKDVHRFATRIDNRDRTVLQKIPFRCMEPLEMTLVFTYCKKSNLDQIMDFVQTISVFADRFMCTEDAKKILTKIPESLIKRVVKVMKKANGDKTKFTRQLMKLARKLKGRDKQQIISFISSSGGQKMMMKLKDRIASVISRRTTRDKFHLTPEIMQESKDTTQKMLRQMQLEMHGGDEDGDAESESKSKSKSESKSESDTESKSGAGKDDECDFDFDEIDVIASQFDMEMNDVE